MRLSFHLILFHYPTDVSLKTSAYRRRVVFTTLPLADFCSSDDKLICSSILLLTGACKHGDGDAAEGLAFCCLAFAVFAATATGEAAKNDGVGAALFKAINGEGCVGCDKVEDHIIREGQGFGPGVCPLLDCVKENVKLFEPLATDSVAVDIVGIPGVREVVVGREAGRGVEVVLDTFGR